MLTGMRLSVRWLCPLFLGVLWCGLSRAVADPQEIVVSPADDLEAALEMVPEGGRIVLQAGIHRPRGALRLERAGVTLAGEPGAEVHVPEDFQADSLLTVRADGVRITGLVLTGDSRPAGRSAAKRRRATCGLRSVRFVSGASMASISTEPSNSF